MFRQVVRVFWHAMQIPIVWRCTQYELIIENPTRYQIGPVGKRSRSYRDVNRVTGEINRTII